MSVQTRASGRRVAKGHFSCSCDNSADEDITGAVMKILVCPGYGNHSLQWYHAACEGEDTWPDDEDYICSSCRSERQASQASSDELQTQDADDHADVRGIRASRAGADGRLEYHIVWADEDEEDQWVRAIDVPPGKLLLAFQQNGEEESVYDSNEEPEELVAEVLHDLDIENANPYWGCRDRGYWSILRPLWQG